MILKQLFPYATYFFLENEVFFVKFLQNCFFFQLKLAKHFEQIPIFLHLRHAKLTTVTLFFILNQYNMYSYVLSKFIIIFS